ncbi:MAG: hypothetical protein ABWY25_02725 [Paenisporosarcina sp.]
MTNWYDPGGNFLLVAGQVVERDALRIAEKIRDYDDNLVLLCLQPEEANVSDPPFVVAENCKDGKLRIVLQAWKLDDQIISRLYACDTHRHDVYNALESIEASDRRERERRFEEEREDLKDKMLHIAGMKSSYSLRDEVTGEKITLFDDRPAERS